MASNVTAFAPEIPFDAPELASMIQGFTGLAGQEASFSYECTWRRFLKHWTVFDIPYCVMQG